MTSTHIDHGDAVYRKTDMGREILLGGRRRLPLRHRQLLVLMDGTRSIGTLRALLGGADRDVESLVRDLHREGLVTPSRGGAGHPPPAASSPGLAATPTPPPSAEQLTLAKTLMLDTAHACLGVLAAKLAEEIEGARDEAQLRRAVAHWNMALRESPRGADSASRHVKEVQAILGWNG